VQAALAWLVDGVPSFVYAACSYYTTCSQSSFTISASPAVMGPDETSALEATNAQCPCSWTIQSQPGGWQVVAGSNCTATLKPVGLVATPGLVVVQATSGASCSKTVTVDTRCFVYRSQVSTDGGSTWVDSSKWIYGKPNDVIDIAVRVVMTVSEGETRAWSYSLRHDASSLEENGGDLEVLGVTTAGTHTPLVKAGLPPDFQETQVRSDSGGSSMGFPQGVLVDYAMSLGLDPTSRFVTAGACYRLTVPSPGVYSLDLELVDDIEDGKPPIGSIMARDGDRIQPCLRELTLSVLSSTTAATTSSSCSLGGNWTTSSDGQPVPQPGGGGGGAGVGPQQLPVPPLPFSLGEVNGDRDLDIADPVVLLCYLFQGGDIPAWVEGDRLPKSGQTSCYDNMVTLCQDGLPPGCAGQCPESELDPFYGQDVHYAVLDAGVPRRYEDFLGEGKWVLDKATGLLWQKLPILEAGSTRKCLTWQGAMSAAEAITDLANLRVSWRLPTVKELQSIVDYERLGWPPSALDPIFGFGTDGACQAPEFYWTATAEPGTPLVFMVGFDWGQVVAISGGPGSAYARAVATFPPPLVGGGPAVPGESLAPGHDHVRCGDADLSGVLNLTDALMALQFLFLGGPAPPVVRSDWLGLDSVERFEVLDEDATGPLTIRDRRTGLIWAARPPVEFVDWELALRRSEIFEWPQPDADFDWRLPNVEEMLSLVDLTQDSGFRVDEVFWAPADLASGALFWASTTIGRNNTVEGTEAVVIDLRHSGFNLLHDPVGGPRKNCKAEENPCDYEPLRYWPVRGGRAAPEPPE
jgi:hypothetical protein